MKNFREHHAYQWSFYIGMVAFSFIGLPMLMLYGGNIISPDSIGLKFLSKMFNSFHLETFMFLVLASIAVAFIFIAVAFIFRLVSLQPKKRYGDMVIIAVMLLQFFFRDEAEYAINSMVKALPSRYYDTIQVKYVWGGPLPNPDDYDEDRRERQQEILTKDIIFYVDFALLGMFYVVGLSTLFLKEKQVISSQSAVGTAGI